MAKQQWVGIVQRITVKKKKVEIDGDLLSESFGGEVLLLCMHAERMFILYVKITHMHT